jgi:alkylhydroperoxidase/carboxymuconolactone decarboxylase family protein YurZ
MLELALARMQLVCWVRKNGMGQAIRFQEVLRKLAIIDERTVKDQGGLSLALPTSGLLDPKTAALVQVGVLVAIGSPAVCLEWGTNRALAAGATEDEITGALLAVGPAAGLGRVAAAVRDVGATLGYDVEAALFDPDGDLRLPPGSASLPADCTDGAQERDGRKAALAFHGESHRDRGEQGGTLIAQ